MTNLSNNSNETLLSYSDYCKDFITNRLDDFEGSTHYVCDFASEITMSINVDGTATYSTSKAKEYLREWWDDCADYFQYEKDNFGEVLHNPFECLEAFHVCMIIQGVSSLLSQCSIIDEHWNDEIEITQEVIDSILKEIENLDIQL